MALRRFVALMLISLSTIAYLAEAKQLSLQAAQHTRGTRTSQRAHSGEEPDSSDTQEPSESESSETEPQAEGLVPGATANEATTGASTQTQSTSSAVPKTTQHTTHIATTTSPTTPLPTSTTTFAPPTSTTSAAPTTTPAATTARETSTERTTQSTTTTLFKPLKELFRPLHSENECTAGLPEQCWEIPHTLCVGNKVVAPPPEHIDLIARWNFDDSVGADTSGKGLHLLMPPKVGPARWGKGQSAQFDGTSYTGISHSKEFDIHDFTVSFWVFLLSDDTGAFRTIVRKGFPEQPDTLTLSVWPKSRRLHLKIVSNRQVLASLDSNGVLPLERWTHVAFNIEGKDIQIFFNGVPDAEEHAKFRFGVSSGPLFIGGDPWLGGIKSYLDDFQIFRGALSASDIQTLAAGALGAYSSEFVRFGCNSCELDAAVDSCSKLNEYHLCSQMELTSGALAVARANGWMFPHTQVWSWEATKGEGAGTAALQSRLAICCSNKNA